MGKVVTILVVMAAFVAGTFITGTAVDAAQGDNQGKPFQELLQNTFAVDSFFDVFYEIDVSSPQCPDPNEIPKIKSDLSGVECSSDFQVDSFFDVFYRIERNTQTNSDDIDQIQTEIVALQLSSLPQTCLSGEVVKFNAATGLWECNPDSDTTYDGTDFALSGQLCESGHVVGIDVNGNLICESSGPTCPNNCSDQGVCIADGVCACNAGFGGADCSEETPACTPSDEVCDNADNDCDGQTDEEVSRSCYTGPPGTEGVGICRSGQQVCSVGQFGVCTGEVTPSSEVCDALDNDCDGSIDDGVHDHSNTFGSPINLGRHCTDTEEGFLCPNTSPRLFSSQSGSTGKFFTVTADECSTCPADLQMRFDLAVPLGINYDLLVFDSNHRLLGSSTLGTSSNESVTVRIDDSPTSDDDTVLVVEIRYISGISCDRWTLNSFNWE